MKYDDTNLSTWLKSLANFAGLVLKKYQVEFAGLLQYICNQLKAEKRYVDGDGLCFSPGHPDSCQPVSARVIPQHLGVTHPSPVSQSPPMSTRGSPGHPNPCQPVSARGSPGHPHLCQPVSARGSPGHPLPCQLVSVHPVTLLYPIIT